MTTFRILSAALIVSSIALTAAAQSRPAEMASTPMSAASMPMDCAKPMAKHDHAAEKGMPKTQSAAGPCPPLAAASKPKSEARHDHAKFNKNQ